MKKSFENRALELDLLRGCAVILMIFDHFMFDLWGLLPGIFDTYPRAVRLFAMEYWEWDVRYAVRIAVVFVFLALTGICSSFSRSNLKRGGKLLAVAMALTAGTFLAGKLTGNIDMTITFGVLHAIAFSLLLVGLLEKLKANKWLYLALGILLWGTGICIALTQEVHLVSYASGDFFVLLGKAVLGLTMIGSDCFDLLTTCGQIFIGMFLGKWLYGKRSSLFGWSYHNNPLSFMGRHSLWIYFAHQILLPVLVSAVLLCMGYTLAI